MNPHLIVPQVAADAHSVLPHAVNANRWQHNCHALAGAAVVSHFCGLDRHGNGFAETGILSNTSFGCAAQIGTTRATRFLPHNQSTPCLRRARGGQFHHLNFRPLYAKLYLSNAVAETPAHLPADRVAPCAALRKRWAASKVPHVDGQKPGAELWQPMEVYEQTRTRRRQSWSFAAEYVVAQEVAESAEIRMCIPLLTLLPSVKLFGCGRRPASPITVDSCSGRQ
jgi:hypothetical protein